MSKVTFLATFADETTDSAIDIRHYPLVSRKDWIHLSNKGKPLDTIENLNVLINHYGIKIRYDVLLNNVEVIVPIKSAKELGENVVFSELLSLASANSFPSRRLNMYLNAIGERLKNNS